MKKLVIICAAMAVAALSLTSCQKEESTTNNQKFIASFEQAGNDKCTIDENLQMVWRYSYWNSEIGVRVPESTISNSDHFCIFYPTSISDDGKTAVLEYLAANSHDPFPADQQGPFYATNYAIHWYDSYINNDGSYHVGGIIHSTFPLYTPMIARAENYGELHFKHLLGILKIYVNMPEGYGQLGGIIRGNSLFVMDGCDVTWDANGEITLSNIERGTQSSSQSLLKGNGFFYFQACPGDWTDLTFEISAADANNVTKRFRKTMNPNASIHIERAGITTLTINFTENDIQN